MSWETYYNFPVSYKKWLIERINKEIQEAAEANKQGGANVPSKAAHHNSPDLRALSGKHRSITPAKLRRFT